MDSNASDADTNGYQEIRKNILEFVQNVKALIGINHGKKINDFILFTIKDLKVVLA